jgi:hypothetical protein
MIYYNSERDIKCISILFILGGFKMLKAVLVGIYLVALAGIGYIIQTGKENEKIQRDIDELRRKYNL